MSVSLDRVAVVMISTVGNAVHTLPVINSLKAHRPGCHVTWIMQPGPAALVRDHPAVDEILVLERQRGVRGFTALKRALAGRTFDVALNLQSYLKSGIATAMTGAPVRIGYDRRRARDLTWLFSTHRLPARPRAHVQDEFLEFLDYLDVPRLLEWRLQPTETERAQYAALLPPIAGPTVALVVGTTKLQKEWPAGRYAELAARITTDLRARVVLVGGRSAREDRTAAAVLAAVPGLLDRREWDLRRLLYLLTRADALVTPDTGPLHMAVALETPTIALMGYTNPKRYGPYRRFHDLMVDAYGDQGNDYPADAGNRPGRMRLISVDTVLGKVALALERHRTADRR